MDVLEGLFYVMVSYIVYKLCDYLYRKPTIFSVTSRRVFITGCDSGFGFELAKRLDQYGCHVFAACLTDEGEDSLKEYCSKRLRTVQMDVTDPQSVRKAHSKVLSLLPEGFGKYVRNCNYNHLPHSGN